MSQFFVKKIMTEGECLKILGASSNAAGGLIDKFESHRLLFLEFLKKLKISKGDRWVRIWYKTFLKGIW